MLTLSYDHMDSSWARVEKRPGQLPEQERYNLSSPMGALVEKLVRQGCRPHYAWTLVLKAGQEDVDQAVLLMGRLQDRVVVQQELIDAGWSHGRAETAVKIAEKLELFS